MPEEAPFAVPVSEMSGSGIAPPGVAVYPSAGQGFSLNPQGHIPIVAKDGQWTMEYTTSTLDIPSTAAHSGSAGVVAISGLAIGDLCFFLGRNTSNISFLVTTHVVCDTEGLIGVNWFNADDVTLDPNNQTYHFLVIHRFL